MNNNINNIFDLLFTDHYKVLKILYENQIKINDKEKFSPLTQIEIAQMIGISKITANSIFKELYNHDLIYQYNGKKGKYCLTSKAQVILKNISKINKNIYTEHRKEN